MTPYPKLPAPFYDVNNPGSQTSAVLAELKLMGGVRGFHATTVTGASPDEVERELLMAFDRQKHGAVYRIWPKPSIFGRIADHYRVLKYNLFRARKARRAIMEAQDMRREQLS